MTNADQLESFGKQLSAQCGKPQRKPPCDWFEAFQSLDRELDSSPTVVFLDEISWMGKYDPGFAGEFKTAWDTNFPSTVAVHSGVRPPTGSHRGR